MSAGRNADPAASDPGAVRRRQLLLFSAVAAVLLVVLAAWLGMGGGGTPAPRGGIEAGIVAPDAAEQVWTRRSEARLGGIETQLREMRQEARRLAADNDRLRTKLERDTADARTVIDRQAAVMDELERRLQAPAQPGTAPGSGTAADPYFRVPSSASSAGGEAQTRQAAPARMIETFELEGGPRSSAGGDRTGPELVADAVAKPVLGLAAGGRPCLGDRAGRRRRLGRHLVAGRSPACADAHHGSCLDGLPRTVSALAVDIDGCTVTGAAHGDLSSEKVYVRFRTMTCAGPRPGTVVETDVAGFVAGSGKTGVRGPVVSREGALVEKAFLAGVVSGVGQGAAQAFQPQAVATGGGAAVANTGLGDIGRAGLGAGASSAGQKVADYMIRRAEQYQPVIQLQAGTKVTLVFLEGARIDGRAVQPQSNDGGK